MFKKALVVDDSELIHKMYKMMLNKYQNAIMISAKNGKEALDRLAVDDGIDLILLDINMPVMNGIQFLENIRVDGKYSHIPIIIISTEGKEEDTLRGLALGARGYIVKPFQSASLRALIESIYKKQSLSVG